MNKLKLNSRRQVFREYGSTLKIESKDQRNKITKTTELKIQDTLKRIEKFNIGPSIPFQTFYHNLRTKSKLNSNCLICDSDLNIEMHHISALKLKTKSDNSFTQVMRNMQRKQIPVCRNCHIKIHKGAYDGQSLKNLHQRKEVCQ